jgi:hypothetical protein
MKTKNNKSTGALGEEAVAQFLIEADCEIIERNWRIREGEIDIIAALSKATLVVEAAFRSGSLRTARDAAEIFRPVMAIPGPINSPTSEGCHRLIGERAAEIVTSVPDAVEFVGVNQ